MSTPWRLAAWRMVSIGSATTARPFSVNSTGIAASSSRVIPVMCRLAVNPLPSPHPSPRAGARAGLPVHLFTRSPVHVLRSLDLVSEELHHTPYRIRRGLAKAADRRVGHRCGQLLEQRLVPLRLRHQPDGFCRADTTRRALAARFVGEKLHDIARRERGG